MIAPNPLIQPAQPGPFHGYTLVDESTLYVYQCVECEDDGESFEIWRLFLVQEWGDCLLELDHSVAMTLDELGVIELPLPAEREIYGTMPLDEIIEKVT